MSQQGSGGNVLAALCNVFIPGLGQLLQGRLLAALGFFLFWAISGALTWVLVGWVLLPIAYLWSIIDAARFKAD
ncbi:MAG: hypothetical protein ACRDBI_07350 [Shewanella sp.]